VPGANRIGAIGGDHADPADATATLFTCTSGTPFATHPAPRDWMPGAAFRRPRVMRPHRRRNATPEPRRL